MENQFDISKLKETLNGVKGAAEGLKNLEKDLNKLKGMIHNKEKDFTYNGQKCKVQIGTLGNVTLLFPDLKLADKFYNDLK